MKYNKYTVLDFVRNENFQKWVKNPDEESNFYWESWMQNHTDKKHLILEAREIITSISFPAKKASSEIMDEVFEKILKNEKSESFKRLETKKLNDNFNIKKTLSIAATVLMIVTFGYIIYNWSPGNLETKDINLNKEIIKVNRAGIKSTLNLSDGSKIKLNASSTLRVADNFGLRKREVYLEGEAFFEISKNANIPFIVHTGNISTLVTGTAFNVYAYHNKNSIKVAVFEGEVKTILYHDNGSDTLSLQKSDMAVYDKPDGKLSLTDYDYKETLGWKDGIIYFRNSNCLEAFDYLEQWYGVDIQVKNQEKILGAFYGEFKNETLENILSAMGKALGFEYQFNDSIIIINPKKH